ncbi:MAG: type I pullulanase [Clostridia bacterium]|nr:type I pullulanase [Clostridia bacterium]
MGKFKILGWSVALLIALSILMVIPQRANAEEHEVEVVIHYYRFDQDYDGWNVWSWIEGGNGKEYSFGEEDGFGKVSRYTLKNPGDVDKVGFIIRKGEWEAKEGETESHLDIRDGKVEVWVVQDDNKLYFTEEEANQSKIPRLKSASMWDFNRIRLRSNVKFKMKNDKKEGIILQLEEKVLSIKDVINPNLNPGEEVGYEIIENRIHFILKPEQREIPNLDPRGGSHVFISGSLNQWNEQGAKGWKMEWNDEKEYYELIKDMGRDVEFGDEFKFINIIDGESYWMEGSKIKIIDTSYTKVVDIITEEKLDVEESYFVMKEGYDGKIAMRIDGRIFVKEEFNDAYFYDGSDLGTVYSKDKTSFRLWAPLAEKVVLMTYKDGDVDSSDPGTAYEMKRDVKGTWVKTLEGDQKGLFYTYKVTNDGVESEAGDPYAIAVGVNGDRSAVVDLSETNPKGWEQDGMPPFSAPQDAVIYELHIRDLTIDEDSGVENKGKYIAFKEKGTRVEEGVTTGIDHLKELGVTHLHILPSYDFASIDEKNLHQNQYNWGYDPENYNVPEGSYSTDPYNPNVRIKEFKEMVKALHENGIYVVMDVVYNHTYENVNSKFHKIVPGYYYRMKEDGTFYDGSFCGNETASERAMMRKYIIDSVKYWVNEYHIDGFRFDLMGIHDKETMNQVKAALSEIKPDILLYGEGWDLGNLERSKRAIQPLAKDMPGIAFFNDNIRDNLKGAYNDEKDHGFVDGRQNRELEVMTGVVGSIPYNHIIRDYNSEPPQSINYVSCHDNHTLWDKLSLGNPDASQEEIIEMHKLANSIVFTCQGIAFLHAGVDFLRTKDGDHNSYISPDSINALDWSRKAEYMDVFRYYQGLIKLRKAHPAFRMPTTEMVKEHITFIPTPKNVVGYVIKEHANNDTWKNIFVAYNANNRPMEVNIPKGNWKVVVDGNRAGIDTIVEEKGGYMTISPLSAVVMHTNDDIKVRDLFTNREVIEARVNSNLFTTDGRTIEADEKVIQREEVIYFPLKGLLKSMIGDIIFDEKEKVIKIKKYEDDITISLLDGKAKKGGKYIESEEIFILNGELMVSSDFVENILKCKVLVDYRRYGEDTQRENYEEPDIFILY